MALIEVVGMSIAGSESLLSIFLNFFIVVFHMRSLRNGMKLNPSSLIQLAMGVTNISMRGLMFASAVASLLPINHVMRMYHTIMVIIPFHLYFSYWLIAWLCANYCVTITNIRHRIFIWMKRSLVSFLPHLLLLSAFVSFTLTLPLIWNLHIRISKDNSTLGLILPRYKFSVSDLNLMLISCLCSCLPFLMTIGSLMVTVSSLFRHIRKMKRNDSGFAPPNPQAHVSAVRTMILFLVLSVTINVAEIVKFMAMSFFGDSLELIIWMMVSTFPLAEASIIIQSSRKMKKMFSQTFCAGRFTGGDN
ncbi:PREDICTED: taste receptor type 2 member 4-like [Nanorana parkeri]|uniref:taste receptor type 2 member 4-like n=1 Tax=Nanorana parkeri TaxID=125878 RepID=UPI000853FF91|nr:PREDICTED: taste receptor type 2 member 4-like [Nanorana parkeri]